MTLAAAAIIQALGQYSYLGDAIIVTGQVFFPVLFALMILYLGYRTRENPRFTGAHVVFGVIGVVLLVLTLIGQATTNFRFYPQPYIYYGAFAGLALQLGLSIAAMPKKPRPAEEEDDAAGSARDAEAASGDPEEEDLKPVVRRPRRRRRPAGSGPTHLVARSKTGGSAGAGGAASSSADAEADADAARGEAR